MIYRVATIIVCSGVMGAIICADSYKERPYKPGEHVDPIANASYYCVHTPSGSLMHRAGYDQAFPHDPYDNKRVRELLEAGHQVVSFHNADTIIVQIITDREARNKFHFWSHYLDGAAKPTAYGVIYCTHNGTLSLYDKHHILIAAYIIAKPNIVPLDPLTYKNIKHITIHADLTISYDCGIKEKTQEQATSKCCIM